MAHKNCQSKRDFAGWIDLLCVMDRFAMLGVDSFSMHREEFTMCGGYLYYRWGIDLLW